MKFPRYLFNKCDQILKKLKIYSYSIKMPFVEYFIFCAMSILFKISTGGKPSSNISLGVNYKNTVQ